MHYLNLGFARPWKFVVKYEVSRNLGMCNQGLLYIITMLISSWNYNRGWMQPGSNVNLLSHSVFMICHKKCSVW